MRETTVRITALLIILVAGSWLAVALAGGYTFTAPHIVAISEAARCARLDWWTHGACAPVWWWHPLAVYFSPSHAWVAYASKAGINS
jgi:hypothetical protein